MQGAMECPVCSDEYDSKTRIPKVLVCGHSTCEHCVRSMLHSTIEPNIMCPECRVASAMPDGEAGSLPTNYSLLRLVDSQCSECPDKPHTQKCGHCPFNVCDRCRESDHDRTDDMKELTQLIEDLQSIIDDDKEIRAIQDKGNNVIEEMIGCHKELIKILDEEHKKGMEKFQAKIRQNIDILLDWRGKVMRLLVECKIFMDEQRYTRLVGRKELTLPDKSKQKGK